MKITHLKTAMFTGRMLKRPSAVEKFNEWTEDQIGKDIEIKDVQFVRLNDDEHAIFVLYLISDDEVKENEFKQ